MLVVTPRSSLPGHPHTDPAAPSADPPPGTEAPGDNETASALRREARATMRTGDGNPVAVTADATLLQMRHVLRRMGDTDAWTAQRGALQRHAQTLEQFAQQGEPLEQALQPLIRQYSQVAQAAMASLDTFALAPATTATLSGQAGAIALPDLRAGSSFAPLRGMLDVLDEIEQRDMGGYLYKYYAVLAAQTEYLKLINELTKVFAEPDFAKRDGDNHLQVDISRAATVYDEVKKQLLDWMSRSQNHGGFLHHGVNQNASKKGNEVVAVSDADFNGRLAFWEQELSGLGVDTTRRDDGSVLFDFKSGNNSELARIMDAFARYKRGNDGRARMTTAEYQHLTRTVDNIRSDFERTLKRTQQRTDNTLSQARSVLDAITRAADDFTTALQAWLNRL